MSTKKVPNSEAAAARSPVYRGAAKFAMEAADSSMPVEGGGLHIILDLAVEFAWA